jgi:hypothetical protein
VAFALLVMWGCASTDKNRDASTTRASTATTEPQQREPSVADRRMVEPIEPQISPEQCYVKGVEFLIANQNENGSWGSFASARPMEIYLDNLSSLRAFGDATTALCLMAMQEPSRHDERALAAVRKCFEYVFEAPPAGRATGGTFYDTWTHTYLTQAMARYVNDERFADVREKIAEIGRREIALLAERQAMEGGFGYYDFGNTTISPSGDQSTSFNTAAALIALHEAKQAGFDVPQDSVKSGLGALQRLRLPSGAYIYGEYARNNPAAGYNQVKGSLGRSQSCNLALWIHRDEIEQPITLEDLLKGVEVMRDEHHFIEIGRGRPRPHEAWYFTAGYYYLFGHYYAAGVINELSTTDRESLRRWLVENMVAIQDPGGSWTDFPLYGFHRCYGAAFGLLTLEQCGVGMQ